jgi:hypothetical protein
MKAKLISIGVLLIAVVWFTSFLLGVNDPPVDHGKVVISSEIKSKDCRERGIAWGSGSWSSIQCENVVSLYTKFEDGHIASVEISRVRIDKPE